MVDVAELNLRVRSDDVSRADQRLGRFNNTATRSERVSRQLANSARQFGRAFAVLGAAAAAAAADSVRLAVEAEETANKFRTVFRGSVAEADSQLIQLSKTVPLTVSQLRGLAASTQDLLVPLGLARDAAADLSVQAVSLAGDIASFNNVGTEDVLRAIQSALAGSSEPMRRFGVDTRETRLQTLALNEGLIEQGEELTAAARGQAVFRAITLDSADAVGDLERTQNSAANASRRLARDLRQVREDLGTALLPAFTALVTELGNTEDGMSDLEAVTRRLFLLIGRLAQGAILAAEGFSTLGKVIALTVGEAKFLLEDFTDGSQFGQALIGESEEAVEAFRRTISARDEFRAAFSEDFTESRAQFKRLFNQLGEGLDDFAAGTQTALEESEELKGGISSLGDVAEDTAEKNAALSESFAEMDSRIADLRAELDGPLSEAIRDFNRETIELERLLAAGEITGDQFVTMLGLLEENFVRVRDEIGQNLAATLEDMITSTLPAFIQQMLGLVNATDQAAGSFLDFGRIGSGFAQSIFQGQSIQDSISSALIGAGGQGLSEEFGAIFEDGFKSALENLGDPDTWKPSAEGFALALGQAASGNIGQAAFTAVGNAIGGPIGALVGSIIGDAIFGESVPKFQVRGVNASQATDAGTDRTVSGALGEIEFAFRDIEEDAQNQIVRAFTQFDQTIAGVIRDESQLDAVQAALDRFGVSSRSGPDTIEGQLNLRLDAILSTFDDFTRNFVNIGDTLEERTQRLSDFFAIQDRLLLGGGFGLAGSVQSIAPGGGSPGGPGFGGGGGGISPDPVLRPAAEEMAAFTATIEGTGDAADVTNPVLQQTLVLLDELAIGGESLVDTFNRLTTVVDALDRAAFLTGAQFADSREGLVRFGADLVAIFGDDAGAFSGLLNRVLEAAFSDEELEAQTIAAARQRASDLLSQLGIAVTEETFTQEGLRDLLENFLGAFGPDQTAQLLSAADAIATIVEITGDVEDAAQQAATGLSESAQIILGSIAPARLEFARLSQAINELIETEDDLGLARQAAQVQIQGFIAALRQSIPNLVDELFGTSEDAGRDIQRGITNTRDAWLRAIDSIQDALDAQLVGPNSSLTNREQLTEIERQLTDAVTRANAGDVGAAQEVAGLFNQAISQGAGFFGTSTDQFADFEARIRELAGSVATQANVPPEITTAQNTSQIARNTERLERTAFEDFQLALQLADQIDLLARLTGDSPAEIGREFGVPIAELIGKLTGEVPNLTGEALATEFDSIIRQLGDDLNDFAGIENLTRTTNNILGQIRDFFIGGEFIEKIGQFAGAAEEGSGTIGGDASFGGTDLGPMSNGGPTGMGGTAMLHAGEFVVPRNGALVMGGNSRVEERLARIESAILTGNSDRRQGVELTVQPLESIDKQQQERSRILRTEASSRPSNRRMLGT